MKKHAKFESKVILTERLTIRSKKSQQDNRIKFVLFFLYSFLPALEVHFLNGWGLNLINFRFFFFLTLF